MEITEDESGHLLKLAGWLDIREADQLREALQDFTDGDLNSAIDVSGVEGCDTAALQLLYSARKTVENAGRRFQIAGLSGAVMETSAALGLPLTPGAGDDKHVA